MDRTFDYLVPGKLASKVALGTLVRVPFGGRVVRGFVLGLSEIGPESDLEVLKGVVIEAPLASPPLAELMTAVARRYVVPRGKAFGRLVPPRVRTEPPAGALHLPPFPAARLDSYSGGTALLTALRERSAGVWCVQALPGEDRGALISEMVGAARDGAALVLVPEVRYGSIVLDRLAEIVPGMARLDSARDDMERSSAWVAMAAGHPLGGGGRGAVFAPAPDLALIVVDEEHHQTYKEDRAPRYDARWVAISRARTHGAVCVFISASPSLETGSEAASGRFGSVSPTREARRAVRPVVELVERPEDRSIGHELHERISDALRDGRRVALLAASPAFARAVWCGDCRRSLRCPRCEAGLFFERGARRVRCARCDFAEQAPDACPSCGGAEFKLVGAGTERLEGQLAKSFPRANVHRVDPADPAVHPVGDVDIYLTTWMGTKPVLRPEVSLVGVLDADWLIRRPDFRSAESAYQAMVEMAEWAGPAGEGGRLVIQTSEPSHHSLQAVVRGDYDFFLRKESEQRKELLYPPFVELVKVSIEGPGSAAVAESVRSAVAPSSMQVLGPVEIRTPGGTSGLQLLIKCPSAEPVADALRVILEGAPKGVRIAVDVDPR